MPTINLLSNAVAEKAAPSPAPARLTGQIILVVLALLAVVTAYIIDSVLSNQKLEAAKARLQKAQTAKAELEKVKKEADEYKKKKDLVEGRLNIIRKLDAERRGPVALMSLINERIPTGVKLEKIALRGNSVVIEGIAEKNRDLVTQFAQQLELRSNGLFTNVDPKFVEGGTPLPDATEMQVLKFTINCVYNPPQPAAPAGEAQTAAK
jgi:type IV pilus assembly protein PilN